MVSIIIPVRNEPDDLAATLAGIKATIGMPGAEVLVVDDCSDVPIPGAAIRHERPMGVSYSRHVGIMRAKYDTCILLDSHMTFMDNGWAWAMHEWCKARPNSFACAQSIRCTTSIRDPLQHFYQGRYEVGARLVDRQVHSCGRREIMARRWNGNRSLDHREVACPLGGAYVLSRSWYREACQQVWMYHRGWGFSEQFIALATWYRGGTCDVIPSCPIGHIYRDARKDHIPYRTSLARVLRNELILAELFMGEDARDDAQQWIAEGHPDQYACAMSDVLTMREMGTVDRLRNHFGTDAAWPVFRHNMIETSKELT